MNEEKSRQLGMPFGTANAKLRKMILFHLLKKHNENICFQCGKVIETVEELSIEHKKPWLHESTELFWDIADIAFSHLHCNSGTHRNLYPSKVIHGTWNAYNKHKCRCDKCKDANNIKTTLYRSFGTSKK